MEKIPIYQSNQKIEDSEKIDFAAEAISLMDLSSQNDSQFSGNQTEPQTCKLSGVLGAEKEVNTTLEIDELRESTDPEKARRNGRCNLRKSLAWDSAFFSNAGVLDPEELSTMIKGDEKDKNQLLPGIEEEIRRSIDSISSLESDNFTLESLEDDLFVDIRASIQRSNKKVPNATNCISKSMAKEIDNRAISTLKKESIASQKKLLVKPALKNTSRQTIRMPKCQPKQNVGTQGSGKAVKKDSGHSQVTNMKTVTKIDEPSSLCSKPPKAISRATLTSTSAAKRDSTGSSHVKSEIGSSKLRPGSQASKVPVSGARRVLPKPAPSSNSSSLGSSTTSKMLPTRSSTSSDSSDSMLSKTTANSPLMSARRIPVKSSTIRPASSDSIPKTPSKAALHNKPPPSTLSAHRQSTKISSSVSPASSISEWSSASSSHSSTVYLRSSNTRNSLDISSCPSIDDSVPLGLRSTDRIADEYKSKGTALTGNKSNKSIAQSGTLQAPAKLSGLRKPSPKIGFFDGAKSIRTSNGTLRTQSDMGNVLTKTGAAICSPKGSSNMKPKTGKFPTTRAVSSLANVKPDSPKSRSPATFPEISCALTNDSLALTGVKDSPSLSPEAQGNRRGENILKSQKVQAKGPDGNKQVLDAGTGAVINENLVESIDEAAFNMLRNIRTEDTKIVLVEDNNAMGSKSIGQRVDKDVLDDEYHWKCLSSILKTTDDQQELSGSKEYENSNVYTQKGEPLSDISDSVSVSYPETASTTTGSRAPFALKDSFYNSECPDVSKESAAQLVEKIVIPLPITEQKENI